MTLIPECLRVAEVELKETQALRALEAGTATEQQQKLALAAIVQKFARTHDDGYIPGAAGSDSAFLNGRRFVGNRILRHLRRPLKEIHPDEVINE